MKRLLIALLVGGMVFGAVYGLAASLGVAGGGAQSGSVSAVCDANGVDLTWQNTDADADFEQATVSGIDCSGTLDVGVDGQDGGHATVAFGTNSAGGSGTTVVTLVDVLSSPADVAALDHTHVSIVQTGP